MLFERIQVWRDRELRSGPENMAIDQWLIENLGEVPVLRIYEWRGDWVSLGYFQSLAEARRIFGNEPEYVRRWTGGGIVDHRGDQTYTLAIPRSLKLASARGGESYAAIHRELAKCLRERGLSCQLAERDSQRESAACFEKPVAWDLLECGGGKLAGAGQRRTRRGILHQGSVSVSKGLLDDLEDFLSDRSEVFSPGEMRGWEGKVERYRSADWLARVL